MPFIGDVGGDVGAPTEANVEAAFARVWDPFARVQGRLAGAIAPPVLLRAIPRFMDAVYAPERARAEYRGGLDNISPRAPTWIAMGLALSWTLDLRGSFGAVGGLPFQPVEGAAMIALCPERLRDASSALATPVDVLTTVVLAHELVHWGLGARRDGDRAFEEATAQIVSRQMLIRLDGAPAYLDAQARLARSQPACYRAFFEAWDRDTR